MSDSPILPGSTLGILGSGQLGRMLALAARRMGYRVHVYSPDSDSPTGQVADVEHSAPYEDLDAVRRFARAVDVVTLEFENVPAAAAEATAEAVADASGGHLRPGVNVLYTAQNRRREKTFLREAGFPVTPFAAVRSVGELSEAVDELGCPAVLKTAGFGYDGKGQVRIGSPGDVEGAWETLGEKEAIVERFIDFQQEVSVVAARGADGKMAHFGVLANTHRKHILDVSICPAAVPKAVAQEAVEITEGILEQLDAVGVLCVEFFVTEEGDLLVNEIAPRPHNSGHLTIDAFVTNQFEQQLRAVCGLPLGSTARIRKAAMANLLGDLWEDGEPNWAAACRFPEVKIHLYGKKEPRPGRKMGHLTAVSTSVEEAEEVVREARRALRARV
jgi:5-(carboxyamino)imidazole ribonucleotide synthase